MQEKRSDRGFTLVELLISVFIIVALSAALFKLLSLGSTSYGSSSQVMEAITDLHVASNLISREIELSGFGVPEGESSVTVSGSSGSQRLIIKGCFSNPSHLIQAASSGDYTIYLDDVSLFSQGDRVLVGDVELKTVSSVGSNYIVLDSSLEGNYPEGSTARRLDTIEYYADQGALYRRNNGGNPHPVLDNVKDFEVEPEESDAPIYTVTITVSPGGDLGDVKISFSASRRI